MHGKVQAGCCWPLSSRSSCHVVKVVPREGFKHIQAVGLVLIESPKLLSRGTQIEGLAAAAAQSIILFQALQTDSIELHLGETHLHIRRMEAGPLDRNPDVIQSCAAGLARARAKTFLLAELTDVGDVIGRPSIGYADLQPARQWPPVERIDIPAADQHACAQ